MKATPEQFNQLGGELLEPELTYPIFLNPDYQRRVEAVARHLKRQQQAAERNRRKQRIKSHLVTAAWCLLIVGLGAAVIVVH